MDPFCYAGGRDSRNSAMQGEGILGILLCRGRDSRNYDQMKPFSTPQNLPMCILITINPNSQFSTIIFIFIIYICYFITQVSTNVISYMYTISHASNILVYNQLNIYTYQLSQPSL